MRHGLTKHPLYACWVRMKNRCYNPNCREYKWYGAKGIEVCTTWFNSFQKFYDWAIDNGWKKGLSIERKKVYIGYCPSNCSWIPRNEQGRNKSDSRFLTINGERLCASEWAKRFGINQDVIYVRLTYGWSLRKAVTTPLMKIHRENLITHNGVTKSVDEWATELGIGRNTIKHRAKMGYDISQYFKKPKAIT